jgi:uncharacterized membrane protein
MSSRSIDPLGKLRYAPLAALPLGVAGLFLIIYGSHDHAHGWLLAGAVLTVIWGVFEIALGLKLLRRIRGTRATREMT